MTVFLEKIKGAFLFDDLLVIVDPVLQDGSKDEKILLRNVLAGFARNDFNLLKKLSGDIKNAVILEMVVTYGLLDYSIFEYVCCDCQSADLVFELFFQQHILQMYNNVIIFGVGDINF